MNRRTLLLAGAALSACGQKEKAEYGYRDTPRIPGQKWRVHDADRPQPPVVTPGAKPGEPPSDAIVLFDGKDLSAWQQSERGQLVTPKWKVQDGYFECTRTGDLVTKEKFGNAQYHVEWAAPDPPRGKDQDRGNSGFIIMGRYEIQILDSYKSLTYADGMAGAMYGQWPPLANAVRPPGEFNVYDIFFEAPVFEGGKAVKPAYATVMLNGVLLHHHSAFTGPVAHRAVRQYEAHGPEEPLTLQDHHHPVRFRNVWVRRIVNYDQPA
jgi:hypothetical protein